VPDGMAAMPHHGLVVDDSRVVRKFARRVLERAGIDVEEAENGQVALEACRARLPRFILLDWNMPVMTGIDFLRALRLEFGPERPEVIFCTTESELGRIVEALDSGAQEYVMKPFDDAILLGKLAQLGLLA
jgi:two-component system, chemotaxis family, chemotaxis protein CheY